MVKNKTQKFGREGLIIRSLIWAGLKAKNRKMKIAALSEIKNKNLILT